MSEVRTLLANIAANMGKPASALEKFVQVLEDNWYDSIESLQSIEDTFWTENKFPARLIQEIKAELNRDSDMEDAHKPAVLKLDTAKPVAPAEPEPR